MAASAASAGISSMTPGTSAGSISKLRGASNATRSAAHRLHVAADAPRRFEIEPADVPGVIDEIPGARGARRR